MSEAQIREWQGEEEFTDEGIMHVTPYEKKEVVHICGKSVTLATVVSIIASAMLAATILTGIVVTYVSAVPRVTQLNFFVDEGCSKFQPEFEENSMHFPWALYRYTDSGLPLLDDPKFGIVETLPTGGPSGFVYEQRLETETEGQLAVGHYVFSVSYSLVADGYMYVVSNFASRKLANDLYPGVTVDKKFFCFWIRANATGYSYNIIFVTNENEQSFAIVPVRTLDWTNVCVKLDTVETKLSKSPVNFDSVTQVLISHENRFLGNSPIIKLDLAQLYFSDTDTRYPHFPAILPIAGILDATSVDNVTCSFQPKPAAFVDTDCSRFYPDFLNSITPFALYTDAEMALMDVDNPGLATVTNLGPWGFSATIIDETLETTTPDDDLYGFGVVRLEYNLTQQVGFITATNQYISGPPASTSLNVDKAFLCFFMKLNIKDARIDVTLASQQNQSTFGFYTQSTEWTNYCFGFSFFQTVEGRFPVDLKQLTDISFTHHNFDAIRLGPVLMEYGLLYLADTVTGYPVFPALNDQTALFSGTNGECTY